MGSELTGCAVSVLSKWWRQARRLRRLRRAIPVASTSDVESRVRPGAVVLIGPKGAPKWMLLGCPCRCGETLWVNLMSGQPRRWELDRDPTGALTLTPSLDVTTCGSHFWIRRGKVVWV